MDSYTTASLVAVVNNLKTPQSALLDMFFTSTIQSTDEEIKFDTEDGKRRITPFVAPFVEGKIIESQGFKTKTFKPAYTKDKRVHDPEKPFKRAMGERIGGSSTPINRRQMAIALDLKDQAEMLTRREEVMVSEVLRTGKVTVSGDGFPTTVVDFGRNAGHTITLSGASRWGQAGIVPLTNLEDWSLTMLQNAGVGVTDAVMDVLAFRLFVADQDTKDQLETRRIMSQSEMDTIAILRKEGMVYKGNVGGVDIWVYAGWYVDENDVEQKIMPDNTVILGSRHMDGVRHYGAIKDEEAGFQAMRMYPKSWVIKDPSSRILLSQSAPLMVPYRPDASMCITVN